MMCWTVTNHDGSLPVTVNLFDLADTTPPNIRTVIDLGELQELVRLEPGESVEFCAELDPQDIPTQLAPFAAAAGVTVGKDGLWMTMDGPAPIPPPEEVVPGEPAVPSVDPDDALDGGN